jgi:uncharacterized protein (TIGR02246 family)
VSASDIVQAQLEAYNAQDLDAFCACFADDCIVANLNGEVTQRGRTALRQRYGAMFATNPRNKARVAKRIAVGDYVIDHEEIDRGPGGEQFAVIAIYTVKGGLITRLELAR